jgi:hypothetical protein
MTRENDIPEIEITPEMISRGADVLRLDPFLNLSGATAELLSERVLRIALLKDPENLEVG